MKSQVLEERKSQKRLERENIKINKNPRVKSVDFYDEIYLLFQQIYSANFLSTLWKRIRKYGAYCMDIAQNVEDTKLYNKNNACK